MPAMERPPSTTLHSQPPPDRRSYTAIPRSGRGVGSTKVTQVSGRSTHMGVLPSLARGEESTIGAEHLHEASHSSIATASQADKPGVSASASRNIDVARVHIGATNDGGARRRGGV